MEVSSKIVFREGPPDQSDCVSCLEPTPGLLPCCGCSMCPECLVQWSEQSNTCPNCRGRIHDGEDKRYLNVLAPEAPAQFVLTRIHQFIRANLRLRQHQARAVVSMMDNMHGRYFPVDEPIEIRVPGPDNKGASTFFMDLSELPTVRLRVVEEAGEVGPEDLEDLDNVYTPTPRARSPRPVIFRSRTSQRLVYTSLGVGVMFGAAAAFISQWVLGPLTCPWCV